MKTEQDLFLEWHYGQYLLENPDVDINNAKYIYDYAHKNPLVYQMRETCFMAWVASASREGYKLVPVEMSLEKADELSIIEWDKNKHLFQSINRGLDATQVEEFRIRWCKTKARQLIKDYKEMVEGVI